MGVFFEVWQYVILSVTIQFVGYLWLSENKYWYLISVRSSILYLCPLTLAGYPLVCVLFCYNANNLFSFFQLEVNLHLHSDNSSLLSASGGLLVKCDVPRRWQSIYQDSNDRFWKKKNAVLLWWSTRKKDNAFRVKALASARGDRPQSQFAGGCEKENFQDVLCVRVGLSLGHCGGVTCGWPGLVTNSFLFC